MKGSPYNLITFQKEAYEETARLHISPKPDSILRVFMVYTPLAQKTGYPAGADIQSCPELLNRVPDIAYAVLDRSGTQACYRAFQDI